MSSLSSLLHISPEKINVHLVLYVVRTNLMQCRDIDTQILNMQTVLSLILSYIMDDWLHNTCEKSTFFKNIQLTVAPEIFNKNQRVLRDLRSKGNLSTL
jgi:hypothetical protein